uniref:Uncharacterized protein n=1 Tax=Pithovirus LCDPAC02 TaxID=2506601 RepID=A0A481YNC4_9VIRU|nr:MAG: hypothetical protein LCDPAC02_00420 [Pithovirus LCDPAC02]
MSELLYYINELCIKILEMINVEILYYNYIISFNIYDKNNISFKVLQRYKNKQYKYIIKFIVDESKKIIFETCYLGTYKINHKYKCTRYISYPLMGLEVENTNNCKTLKKSCKLIIEDNYNACLDLIDNILLLDNILLSDDSLSIQNKYSIENNLKMECSTLVINDNCVKFDSLMYDNTNLNLILFDYLFNNNF